MSTFLPNYSKLMKEPALANMAHVYQACIAILTNQKQKP